jgi:hypothetical protein
MAESWAHRHPVLATAAGGVLTAIVVGIGAQLLGLISLKAIWLVSVAAVVATWHWLFAASPLPHWLILVLGFSGVAWLVFGVTLAVAFTKAVDMPPTSGEYFGMRWRWDWNSKWQPAHVEPFCIECDMQLVPSDSRLGMMVPAIYYCTVCKAERYRTDIGMGDMATSSERHRRLQSEVALLIQREARQRGDS